MLVELIRVYVKVCFISTAPPCLIWKRSRLLSLQQLPFVIIAGFTLNVLPKDLEHHARTDATTG